MSGYDDMPRYDRNWEAIFARRVAVLASMPFNAKGYEERVEALAGYVRSHTATEAQVDHIIKIITKPRKLENGQFGPVPKLDWEAKRSALCELLSEAHNAATIELQRWEDGHDLGLLKEQYGLNGRLPKKKLRDNFKEDDAELSDGYRDYYTRNDEDAERQFEEDHEALFPWAGSGRPPVTRKIGTAEQQEAAHDAKLAVAEAKKKGQPPPRGLPAPLPSQPNAPLHAIYLVVRHWWERQGDGSFNPDFVLTHRYEFSAERDDLLRFNSAGRLLLMVAQSFNLKYNSTNCRTTHEDWAPRMKVSNQ